MPPFDSWGNDYQLLEEQQCQGHVTAMAWCPTMDLVALALDNGQVHVRRLSWQRVWMLDTLEEKPAITALCWSPDGQQLALAYSSGMVHIHTAESSQLLASQNLKGTVVKLLWQASTATHSSPGLGSQLPALPTDKLKSSEQEPPKLPPSNTTFSLLFAATDNQQVHVLGLGTVFLGSYHLAAQQTVCDMVACHDLSSLSVLTSADRTLNLAKLDLSQLSDNVDMLAHLISISQFVASLAQHVSASVTGLLETNQLPLKQLAKPLKQLIQQLRHKEVERELLTLLATGRKDNLEVQAFINTGVNTRMLNQASAALAGLFDEADSVLTLHVSRCLEHLLSAAQSAMTRLTMMGSVRWGPYLRVLRKIQGIAAGLCTNLVTLKQELAVQRRGAVHFLNWLSTRHQLAAVEDSSTVAHDYNVAYVAHFIAFLFSSEHAADMNVVPALIQTAFQPKKDILLQQWHDTQKRIQTLNPICQAVLKCIQSQPSSTKPFPIATIAQQLPDLSWYQLTQALRQLNDTGYIHNDASTMVLLQTDPAPTAATFSNVPFNEMTLKLAEECRALEVELGKTIVPTQATSMPLSDCLYHNHASIRYTTDTTSLAVALATAEDSLRIGLVDNDCHARFATLALSEHKIKSVGGYKDGIAMLTSTEAHSGIVIVEDDALLEALEATEPTTGLAELSEVDVNPTTSRVIDGLYDEMALSLRQIGSVLAHDHHTVRLVDLAGEEESDDDEDEDSDPDG
eukprot:m.138566 g.138566  ORF g.138566 m.138566 type:complete len:740 (+) comp16074_c0_seq3:71-2290(+)